MTIQDTTTSLRATVAVLTYQRTSELREVLPLLASQASAIDSYLSDVDILVIDNDPAGSGAPVVTDLALSGVRYVCEPTPGIAAARNRALDESADAQALIFIDDDERPQPGWLASLLTAHQHYGEAGVAGPVRSEFPGDLDPWIAAGGFFDRSHRDGVRSGTTITAAATNNLLLDLDVLKRHQLRFDTSLGLSGGEDTIFTRSLTSRGERIVWCAEAQVTEAVLSSRMNRRYVLQRAFSHGNTHSRTELRHAASSVQHGILRIRLSLSGTGRLVLGLGRALLGLIIRSTRTHARGSRLAARGLGLTTGAWGYGYEEYRRA